MPGELPVVLRRDRERLGVRRVGHEVAVLECAPDELLELTLDVAERERDDRLEVGPVDVRLVGVVVQRLLDDLSVGRGGQCAPQARVLEGQHGDLVAAGALGGVLDVLLVACLDGGLERADSLGGTVHDGPALSSTSRGIETTGGSARLVIR